MADEIKELGGTVSGAVKQLKDTARQAAKNLDANVRRAVDLVERVDGVGRAIKEAADELERELNSITNSPPDDILDLDERV